MDHSLKIWSLETDAIKKVKLNLVFVLFCLFASRLKFLFCVCGYETTVRIAQLRIPQVLSAHSSQILEIKARARKKPRPVVGDK